MTTGPGRQGRDGGMNLQIAAVVLAGATDWREYEAAIRRWEGVLGRTAPPPTQPARRSPFGPQLSSAFAEWMMGLPFGWVTGNDLALTRGQALSLLGDGVVPQQGTAAFAACLADLRAEAAA